MKRTVGLYGKTVYYLLIWTIFQEIVLGIIYHYIHITPLVKAIFFSKDVLMVVLYIVAITKKLPSNFLITQILYIILVFIGVGTSLMKNKVSIMTVFSTARGLMLLPAFTTIGYSVKDNEGFIYLLKTRYMKLLVFAALVGIIDYALDVVMSTKGFWTNFVQLGNYMRDIKGQGGVLSGDLPGNFYTYSSLGIFTQKRLVSFWAGPLTSGYCLLIPFVYYVNLETIYKKKRHFERKNLIYIIIVGIALILSFTRAIILPAIAYVAMCFVYKYRRDGGRLFLLLSAFLFGITAVALVYWNRIFGYVMNGSTVAHINSVASALGHVGFLGKGTGTFGAATTEGVWSESTYIAVAGQLGIVAAILYIILLLWPIRKVLKNRIKLDSFTVSIALSGLIFFITGFVSGQLNAYTTIAPYYVMAGLALKNSKIKHLSCLRNGELALL